MFLSHTDKSSTYRNPHSIYIHHYSSPKRDKCSAFRLPVIISYSHQEKEMIHIHARCSPKAYTYNRKYKHAFETIIIPPQPNPAPSAASGSSRRIKVTLYIYAHGIILHRRAGYITFRILKKRRRSGGASGCPVRHARPLSGYLYVTRSNSSSSSLRESWPINYVQWRFRRLCPGRWTCSVLSNAIWDSSGVRCLEALRKRGFRLNFCPSKNKKKKIRWATSLTVNQLFIRSTYLLRCSSLIEYTPLNTPHTAIMHRYTIKHCRSTTRTHNISVLNKLVSWLFDRTQSQSIICYFRIIHDAVREASPVAFGYSSSLPMPMRGHK